MPSLHEKPCATNISLYPTMFPSTAWWNYELPFMYRYCILDNILLELVFPFFLEGSASMMSLHSWYYFSSWTIVTCSRNKSHSSLLVGNYVCDLSYKSNAFVWLETFHKECSYWKIIMHKYMSMQLLYPIQHSSISHINVSRCLPSLPGQHWDCALIQYVNKEASF